ncbi:hypothetical protein [Streptomyces lavenduligriseus]|nr:hypothetical protein [Streptomyces lavenduligriseus]
MGDMRAANSGRSRPVTCRSWRCGLREDLADLFAADTPLAPQG